MSQQRIEEAADGENAPQNIILYGPPGTGKTYVTTRRCVEICDGSAERLDEEIRYEEIRCRYNELVESGRVEFITFHQSYGYEEFVEGLRPDTGREEFVEGLRPDTGREEFVEGLRPDTGRDEGDDGTGFRLVPTEGVLKRIARRARVPEATNISFDFAGRRIFKMGLGNPDYEEDQGIFDECIRNGYALIGWCPYVDWSDSRYDDRDEILSRCQEENPNISSNNGEVRFTHAFRNTMQCGDIIIVSNGLERFRAVGEVVGPYEFMTREDESYPHRRAVRWHWHDTAGAPISEILYEGRMTQGTVYKFGRENVQIERLRRYLGHDEGSGRRLPHVLVIDEINRANISKVMGELVTLLEEDKREGAPHEVTVTLPHSQERFTLPANLYILGTMNTADRSIALLDTALRRRFDFEELPPNPDLLSNDVEGIDLQKVLRAMNDRLEWLVDRDHLIGHAWLMKAKTKSDVDRVMQRKIIPLIAEYFYDDWEKVRAVLGNTDDFVKRKPLSPPPGIEDVGEDRYRWTVQDKFEDGAYDRLISGSGQTDTE